MAFSDPQNRRPEPTRLVLLHQIREQEQGTKIRFLGCVHAYSGKRGFLVLKQDFPATTAKSPMVLANISSLLETMNRDLLQTGAWINIVGYVRKPARSAINEDVRRDGKTSTRRRPISIPYLEAIMIWSAGAVNVTSYTSAARSYQESLPTAS
ncbi:hypothetical protein AC578_1083 [Pseudocercospora eumusae]|uniref:Uncharacterized protein n=1 Tax=Pseudocercospora eumusae TaxID=321146 RepID=A0A139HTE7_9PEZI|nr:hypothetical protein AC578_1083 [Pseudocercospora eumusae]